ncbi:MAG: DUF3369 domain-containing protein [Motiliproteus sp.]
MPKNDDDLMFAPEDDDSKSGIPVKQQNKADHLVSPWKILIVDDDETIHTVTKLVLRKYQFLGRPIEFFSVYSGAESRRFMEQHDDIALIFMDVVMETDRAGLEAIKYIREELENKLVRIILRTGEPGQAPEAEVIVNYDINDYKNKTELTAQKLFTTVIAALRNYGDLVTIHKNQLGLRKIVASTDTLFDIGSARNFVSGVLTQLTSFIDTSDSGMLLMQRNSPDGSVGNFELISATGIYEKVTDFKEASRLLSETVLGDIIEAAEKKKSVFLADKCVMYIPAAQWSNPIIAYVEAGSGDINKIDKELISLFCSNLSIAFQNRHLIEEIESTHEAVVGALAKLAEFKDKGTGDHIQRVAKYCTAIAQYLYDKRIYPDVIDSLFVEEIGMASILHDVGKVAVSRRVLMKPGKLTDEEFTHIKTHAQVGRAILRDACRHIDHRNILRLGAEISGAHHEKLNGTGYPDGLKGEEIPVSGRIVSVVDVYDALTSDRPYKKAWDPADAIALIRRDSGTHFDPVIVEAFLSIIDKA